MTYSYREQLLNKMKHLIWEWWPERHDSALRRYGLREMIKHTKKVRNGLR